MILRYGFPDTFKLIIRHRVAFQIEDIAFILKFFYNTNVRLLFVLGEL